MVVLQNSVQNGRTCAKVRATKSSRNFSQQTHLKHPIRPQNDVLLHFVLFGCIRDRLVAIRIQCKTGRTSSKVRETKSHRNFSQRTHPIHPVGPKTDVLVRFVLFGCIRDRLVALRNSLQKIPTGFCGTNFCTSSAHFAPSFVKQPNGPECTQIV